MFLLLINNRGLIFSQKRVELSIMNLTQKELKLINFIKKDIIRNGDFAIPLDHSDNNLTRNQARLLKEELVLAKQLEKKNILQTISKSRREYCFIFREDWLCKQNGKKYLEILKKQMGHVK